MLVKTPSLSGKGQIIARCPKCFVAVWSNYPGGGAAIRFVRAGTLDEPQSVKPDVHIYTGTRVPWVVIPEGVEMYDEFYDAERVWGKEADVRRWEILEGIKKTRAVEGIGSDAHE